MKTKYFILAAIGAITLASCSNDEFIGDNSPTLGQEGDGSIQFTYTAPNATRAVGDPFIGATAAEKLGKMFVVEGTKGSEQGSTTDPDASNSPSTTVVFDNYLVGYNYNSAGTTESNTNNWEYVGLQTGITGKLSGATWGTLHPSGTSAQVQSIKYWDYSVPQYDFIAWSTGNCEAIAGSATVEDGKVKVTRINTGVTLASNGFKMTAYDADDLLECYYTDINTVTKASGNYGKPVTLTFRNMAAKVRVALYETVPGYSVKDVKFYTAEAANPAAPADLGSSNTTATLYTPSASALPKNGEVTVYYPHIGLYHRDASPQTDDYNKASVTVASVTSTSTTETFGELTNQYRDETGLEPDGKYLGTNLPDATFAGDATKSFYTAVIPNTNGQPLTLRVDYTLVSTDGSAEEIKVYGAKAVVPATYTIWQPNYAYTYIFKISDNSNGWTDTDHTKAGLFPITFDAVVTSFIDANDEQTTVTTVATPSITTYQQGHDYTTDEYSKTQTAGASSDKKDLYVQVMNNSTATPTLVSDLNTAGKSLLFQVSKANASEAEVMDALQNRTNKWDDDSPVGRNGITLTANANISNTETSIVNGVDDQPITKIAGTAIAAGQVAKIDIDNASLTKGTYAYVYCTKVPSKDEKVYHVVAGTTASAAVGSYYEVDVDDIVAESSLDHKAIADKVYFIKNVDANGDFVSYTFKQTKVGDDVTGLFVGNIADKGSLYDADNFYFDVYNQNDGEYAVKVIKIVD